MQCGFGQLVACDGVAALGAAVDGDRGDISLTVARTDARHGAGPRTEEIVVVEQGESKLAALWQLVKDQLEEPGNWHSGRSTRCAQPQ